MERRVVVTGLGVISCVGNDVGTFWNNLLNGVCGIETVTEFPVDGMAVKIAGLIHDFSPELYGLEKSFVRKQDPFIVYAAAAAQQAVSDSGIVSGENVDPYRLATYICSGTGGFHTIEQGFKDIFAEPDGKWVSPHFIPNMISNMAAGQVAIRFGARGSCMNIVTACATSTHGIGEAARAIRHGYADVVLAGGVEASTIPLALASFGNARALTRAENPKYACLPFNLNRGGFVIGDGAAVITLEEMEHAKARGAHIYAELVGYGVTCDAYHATAPRPDGSTQAECIRQALAEAEFDPVSDTVYINAHGTGTALNDVAETKAYKLAMGDAAYRAHISSTKSMHAHMMGATGAAEAIATILALQEGVIPPTINLDVPDPECDLDYTPNTAVKADISLGISDSFGFGGHNGCLAFRKA